MAAFGIVGDTAERPDGGAIRTHGQSLLLEILHSWCGEFQELAGCPFTNTGAPGMNMMGTVIIGEFQFPYPDNVRFAPPFRKSEIQMPISKADILQVQGRLFA